MILKTRLQVLFQYRWPHLLLGPLTTLALGGRPKGLLLLLAWGPSRSFGRRAWADERWLLNLPLGWLDPASQRPGYFHRGGVPGGQVDIPDKTPFFNHSWLKTEFAASLLAGTPRRHSWTIPAPLAFRAQVYSWIRVKRVARALLLLVAVRSTYWTLGTPALRVAVNPWLDEDGRLELPLPPAGSGRARHQAGPTMIGFPEYSGRWAPRHLGRLYAWVGADLDLSWGRGLGHAGPANGHRRPLSPGPTRFLAPRHRSWAVDET